MEVYIENVCRAPKTYLSDDKKNAETVDRYFDNTRC